MIYVLELQLTQDSQNRQGPTIDPLGTPIDSLSMATERTSLLILLTFPTKSTPNSKTCNAFSN